MNFFSKKLLLINFLLILSFNSKANCDNLKNMMSGFIQSNRNGFKTVSGNLTRNMNNWNDIHKQLYNLAQGRGKIYYNGYARIFALENQQYINNVNNQINFINGSEQAIFTEIDNCIKSVQAGP